MINYPEPERPAVEELLRSKPVREFNWLRCQHSFWKPDLAGFCLQGLDLEEANFREACLSGIHLSGAKLRYVDFRWASLCGADLSEADVSGADLKGANLTGANLTGTVGLFEAKNLEGCILQGAKVSSKVLWAYCRRLRESCGNH